VGKLHTHVPTVTMRYNRGTILPALVSLNTANGVALESSRTGILNELVKVREMVDRVVFAEIDRQVSQSVEYGHVELIVLFWT
jgi:hypothetical protein